MKTDAEYMRAWREKNKDKNALYNRIYTSYYSEKKGRKLNPSTLFMQECFRLRNVVFMYG